MTSYDDFNRVTEIADARQGITAFTHDRNGNLLSVTDAKGQTTTFTYDLQDRLETRTDALNRTELYEYDPNGKLTRFLDRKTQESTFTYDSLNRRTGAAYDDGSSTAFAYDSVGRLATAEDSLAGRIEFSYDILDRLIRELTPQGVIEYTYDALGQRTAMTANGQQPVTYDYDAASRLTQVAQGTQVVGTGYDAAGRRTSLTYPNGTGTTYSYDAASRLLSILHQGPAGVIDSLTYAYDSAGNRTNFTRANGTASLLPAPVTAAYDAANEQIQFGNPLPGSPNLTFDANGNLTSQTDASGTTTYTWDARNRLVAITGPSLSASFQYDALGRRISKTINAVTTQFLYDANDIVAEIGGGAVTASYLRNLNLDEPFVRESSSNEYYHTDALGSALALSNSAGTVNTSYAYEAFGKTTVAGTSQSPFQFTGRENDGIGLFFFRARYYSPALHRFISEDPIGFRGGINRYAYVSNNPITFRDPFGLKVDDSGASNRLKAAVDLVRRSPKGKQLFDELDSRKAIYKIRDMRPGDPLDKCQIPTACYRRSTREIIVDTRSEKGLPVQNIPSSIERRVAHEMSHGVHGVGAEAQAQMDDGDVVEQLGLPELRWPGF